MYNFINMLVVFLNVIFFFTTILEESLKLNNIEFNHFSSKGSFCRLPL